MTCSLISEPSLTWRPLDGADRPLPLSRCRGPIQRWRPTQRAGREDECFKWKYESKKEVKEEVEEEEEENDIRISKRRKEQTTHTHTKKKMGSLWKWSAPEDSVSPWNEEKLWKKKNLRKKKFSFYIFFPFFFSLRREKRTKENIKMIRNILWGFLLLLLLLVLLLPSASFSHPLKPPPPRPISSIFLLIPPLVTD